MVFVSLLVPARPVVFMCFNCTELRAKREEVLVVAECNTARQVAAVSAWAAWLGDSVAS